MKLLIHIRKENGRPSVLRCNRENGTSTHSKLYPNLEIHDIAHYIVEKQLGYKNAFYGLLAQGYEINDFQLPKDKKPWALQPSNMHPEALVTEHIVNLLQTAFIQPGPELDIIENLKFILKDKELPFPENLTQNRLESIRKELNALMEKWAQTPKGSELKLIFEL